MGICNMHHWLIEVVNAPANHGWHRRKYMIYKEEVRLIKLILFYKDPLDKLGSRFTRSLWIDCMRMCVYGFWTSKACIMLHVLSNSAELMNDIGLIMWFTSTNDRLIVEI